MKVAIIGANGQLGRDVWRACMDSGDDVVGLTHADVELRDCNSVAAVLDGIQPHAVVNCAAMHQVEACERDEPAAFAVNSDGARNVAAASRRIGAVLIHVSTDYVFDGSKQAPYVETDEPRPLNVYGKSKAAGESWIRNTAERYFIVRTGALYGKHPCRGKGGLNFVELILKLSRERDELRVVDSEVVTPTSTAELARQIVSLSRTNCYGLYHATAEGECSWYEFAREILAATGRKPRLTVAAPNEFPAKVARPAYSVLENAALKANGLNAFRPWRQGLYDYLREREG